ncbi:MAG: hypothetical protein KAJ01_09400 [Candidatus Hydrogenedentes bacterium]|nr:hypothetical protein [Candidatus Hydrogenedentota bacterium]
MQDDKDDLTSKRIALLEEWAEDPWAFLTAKDEDGEQIVWTKDEKDKIDPVKVWYDEPYLEEIIKVFHNEESVMLDKSRQMIITTGSVQYASWDCTFHYGRQWILSKNSEEQAAKILWDKVRFPWQQWPDWLRHHYPISMKPAKRVDYPKTGSSFLAAGENIQDAIARGGTCSGVIVDEAARQRHLEEIITACVSMTDKMFLITTAEMGNPGARLFFKLLERKRRR